jgi:hypothetical protein
LSSHKKVSLNDYLTSDKPLPVFAVRITPNFNPIDINLKFLMEEGWTNADRFRFHFKQEFKETKNEIMNQLFSQIKPHILIRKYDKPEDCFLTIHVNLDGTFDILSNDEAFADKYLKGLFLEFPPSFYSIEDLEISKEWVQDSNKTAFFTGLLAGTLGWDPLNDIPTAIKNSLEEAKKAISIANYRSCVVMCRRTGEALLKFAFKRLLNKDPLDTQGRALTFDAIIRQFRQQQPPPIPAHLLHILDSIRVIGNVPGAHPVEIEGYKFSKLDAEFTLASIQYFIEQYFSQIDKEVTQYYTLTIDL